MNTSAARVIHRDDSHGIAAEQLLDGNDPVALDKDFLAIPVPGHTRGHIVILYRNKFLFTGDHSRGRTIEAVDRISRRGVVLVA